MENEKLGRLGELTMLCPICNQKIATPVQGYHVKPVPWEQMTPANRPTCEMPKCRGMGKWNVNNGHVICEKHLIGLSEQGKPIFILARSLMKLNGEKKDAEKK